MNQAEHCVCLLLGSNIEPEKNMPRSIYLLQKHLTVLQTSSVWESQAVGCENSPNVLNAAVLALTPLSAASLKEQVIRPLEAQLGRVRTQDKNSPRTMDMDLILFDQELQDALLWKYAYRAVPVSEILPEYQSEAGETLRNAAACLASITPIWIRTDVSAYPFSNVFQKIEQNER